MIIRTTVKDNDFTNILEIYWGDFIFRNYNRVVRKIEDPKEYMTRNVEAEELLQKAIFNEDNMSMEEVKRFVEIIKESILDYIKEFYTKDYDYLSKNLEVNVRCQISDKNQNGEVVYYFLGIKKYLVF